jgi:hypothetical protein
MGLGRPVENNLPGVKNVSQRFQNPFRLKMNDRGCWELCVHS